MLFKAGVLMKGCCLKTGGGGGGLLGKGAV